MEQNLPDGTSVIPTLPSMPCAVQAGVTAFCEGENASDADVRLLDELLLTTGEI